MFASFATIAAMPPATIDTYGPLVPPEVVQSWQQHGIGFVGDDGYFRQVDPARAASMLNGTSLLPEGAVVLFTTAMADLIVWWNQMFLAIKLRLGEIHATSIPFTQLTNLMGNNLDDRDVIWDWQPYPQAAARLGSPSFEDCFMHVPLLALGGRRDPNQMQPGSLWIHLAMMRQLSGPPTFTHMLPLPTEQ